MSISRRRFIRAGAIAALAAGVSLRPGLVGGLAQDLVDKVGAPISADPLSYFTQATFVQYLNSIFTLRGRTTVEVTLTKVEDTLPAKASRVGGRESFELHFRGGSIKLPQDTYIVEHPALGTFRLFLVPSGADENGAQGYVAVINRLAYAAKPVSPGTPRKPLGTKRSIISPADPKPTEGKPARKGSEPEGSEELETSRRRRSLID